MRNNSGNILFYILIPLGIIFLLGLSSYAIFYASKNFVQIPSLPVLPTSIPEQTSSDLQVSPTLSPITTTSPSPTITLKPSIIPSVAKIVTTTITPRPKTTATKRSCEYSFDSRFGEKKCFTLSDYGDLMSLDLEYEGKESLLEGAKRREGMTCDGSEFFKSSCEDAKQDIKDLENELEDIESEAKKIISRGWKN